MTDEPTGAEGTMSPSRLAQFEDEVSKLKVTGGGANPERLGSQWGIGLTILGFVIAIISWWSAKDNSSAVTALRANIFALIGVGVALVGIIIWLRNSLTRVPALLDHPARLRTARADRPPHPRAPRREITRREISALPDRHVEHRRGRNDASVLDLKHRDEHLVLPG